MTHSITPIGHIITPFTQKFSIPRQGISLSCASGEIVFADHIDVTQALDGIDAFSHLWLLFLFHENLAKGFKQKVRPPRLGGNQKIGVFASRSSFRPNGIGMSVVENMGIKNKRLVVAGVDLLNGTPIVDIKPYLPYADAVTGASAGFAQEKPSTDLALNYSSKAALNLAYQQTRYPKLSELIHNTLSQDPRPSYKRATQDTKRYFVQLYDIEISFVVGAAAVEVIDIYPIVSSSR